MTSFNFIKLTEFDTLTTFSYSQEFPTRFRKDVIKAACKKSSESSSNLVSAEGIQFILDNIGAGDQMSRSEIELRLREICADASGNAKDPCLISADQLLGVISNRSVV